MKCAARCHLLRSCIILWYLAGGQNVRTLELVTVFEWDEAKAKLNERKHGVLFSTEAVSVFADPEAITITDQESEPSEQRFITVGLSFKG